jgi:NADH:ubiquinone oxidoreductase subunit F (NADH-binding)/(2Fe-2S) ferredoxin
VKKSLEELKQIGQETLNKIGLRVGQEAKTECKKQIMVCGGTGCHSQSSHVLIGKLKEELKAHGLDKEVEVIQTGCFGLCQKGPIVVIYPEGTFYSHVQPEDFKDIVEKHIIADEIVDRLVLDEIKADPNDGLNHLTFYKKQNRNVLAHSGLIDPENIDEYLAMEGYQSLYKVLTTMSQDEVIQEMLDSGLRGRGGAGFPTGMKWKFARMAKNDKKFVVCNADEGDPGAFMDRSVLEGDPHVVIEAMAIAAFAIGADEGYVYVRAEYPIAVKRLMIAIDQAKEYGVLGEDIMGTGFNFDLHIRLGAGAFVCGEETALLSSVEGKRGEPRPRPPFPANSGAFGKPTIVNNVETLANIPKIIRNGAQWFADMGTEDTKGTKVFALGGKIENTGLVEVPMGTTIREIVYDIGGGIPNNKKFKAAQSGGPSGGCIPAQHLDTPIDFKSLAQIGSMMGSGGLIIMDEDNCMVDVARFFMDFIVDESCGKCSPCRIGTKRMLEILEKICDGRGEDGDIEKLEELAKSIKAGSLCALGQTAANPVLSTLRYFRDEYEAHIYDKKCPAGVCKNLLSYVIDKDKCVGCSLCSKKCPVGAISGQVKSPFEIDQSKCIKCGVCEATCKFGAISKK